MLAATQSGRGGSDREAFPRTLVRLFHRADSAASDPRTGPPPTSRAQRRPGAKGPFFFFLKQSYLFTLISCLKNVNKITQ